MKSGYLSKISAGASLAALLSVTCGSASAASTGFLSHYFDVATSTAASAAGYGGAGSTGGAGDELVRLINPTHNSTQQLGTICAMIYVFDDIEEMQACCGCPLTPDGLRTLSVINNLTPNFGVNHANLNAGMIDIIGSNPNLSSKSNSTYPAQIGKIGLGQGGLYWACDPSGGFSSSSVPAAPEPGIVGYISPTEGNVPVPATATLIKSVSVDEFSNAIPDGVHIAELQNLCLLLIQNGSGSGACTCGSGDSISK